VVCHLLAPDRAKRKEWRAELELLSQAYIWFDIAAVPKILTGDVYPFPDTHEYLAEAKSIVTAKKMMWGTDAPFAATNDSYENLTDYLQKGSAFTEEELEDVYYNNAKQVYFD
jgi:predicted TIM-barrel fold metal-dependent hydrolase